MQSMMRLFAITAIKFRLLTRLLQPKSLMWFPLHLQPHLLFFCVLYLFSFEVYADFDSGTAKVVDGDGLIINGFEHRLHGIDAVEADQGCQDQQGKVWLCGQRAREVLQSLVAGETVDCNWTEKDRWGRRLSTCSINDVNLNAAMVFTGYAIAYRQYSERYVLIEKEAKENRNGIWQGEFAEPSEHRRTGQKLTLPPPDSQRRIKGNISRSGNLYYHCPGDESYAKTMISEVKGERWFATAAEAQAAGWSRAPNFGPCLP